MTMRNLRYFGHIMLRDDFDKEIKLGSVEGKRRQRRPPMFWFDVNKRWTGKTMAEAV